MVEVKCRCGKTKRNFKVNVGFFVDECCVEAGYDDLGNLTKKPFDTSGLPDENELAAAAAELKDDESPEPADPTEETPEKTEESTEETAKEETKEEKRARLKAEKAAAMAAQRKAEKEAKSQKAE